MRQSELQLGLYEKALPKQSLQPETPRRDISWQERLRLAAELGFQFVEISIDETAERLTRLDWSRQQKREFCHAVSESGLRVPSMCLSAQRKYPLGSHRAEVRQISLELLQKAIQFAADTGIRTIQLAGYDVYYDEHSDAQTQEWFAQGLAQALRTAARENVMLAMEIMDTVFMSSIVRFLKLRRRLDSPWLTVYPDVGNLSAWGADAVQELELGWPHIAAIHLKDTLKVTAEFGGKFRDVPFGQGCVDFVAIFACLTRLDYTGPLVLEMWSEQAAQPTAEIRAARQWIIAQMQAGGYLND